MQAASTVKTLFHKLLTTGTRVYGRPLYPGTYMGRPPYSY